MILSDVLVGSFSRIPGACSDARRLSHLTLALQLSHLLIVQQQKSLASFWGPIAFLNDDFRMILKVILLA